MFLGIYILLISNLQAFQKLSRGMVKLADESESFKSKTILGLLRGAPDLFPNVKHIQEMFKPVDEEGVSLNYFHFECRSLTLSIDADELIPADGKDEMYDEVVSEIRDLESSLEAELPKFEKTLGYVMFTGTRMVYRFNMLDKG